MAKVHVTRTYGPIHFEDLEAHRFEDLVRELIYDFKDWYSIEATGRGGGDEGFDIRAFEKKYIQINEEEEDSDENSSGELRAEGNLWMIQCKRESEVGPTKIAKIISQNIKPTNPPYGYILVTSANLSKKSYDVFREELRKLGVMEFYVWGKAELEDLLHMPKYDRVLFTFFGISLVSRRKSKTSEIKFKILNKNKLLKILKETRNIKERVLIRDLDASQYPWEDRYDDFKINPKWISVIATQFSAESLWVKFHEYYAYINTEVKEWDYIPEFDFTYKPNEILNKDSDNKNFQIEQKIKYYWENQREKFQGIVEFWGEIPFEEMMIIDDKGDIFNECPHIYVDFKAEKGPFRRTFNLLEIGSEQLNAEKEQFKKIDYFPKNIPEKKFGIIYSDKKINVDDRIVSNFSKMRLGIERYHFIENDFSFLNPGDVILIESSTQNVTNTHARITAKYKIKVSDYLKDQGSHHMKGAIQNDLGREVNDEEILSIIEFRPTYSWEFEKEA